MVVENNVFTDSQVNDLIEAIEDKLQDLDINTSILYFSDSDGFIYLDTEDFETIPSIFDRLWIESSGRVQETDNGHSFNLYLEIQWELKLNPNSKHLMLITGDLVDDEIHNMIIKVSKEFEND